ncbi:hypothetical protein A2U01_0087105, partial [Trifolium medium]|nr:hypothetical protein [Trifolium medium]
HPGFSISKEAASSTTPTKPTAGAKEHLDTNQIRRKTKVMSPENWKEGGVEGQRRSSFLS